MIIHPHARECVRDPRRTVGGGRGGPRRYRDHANTDQVVMGPGLHRVSTLVMVLRSLAH